MRKIIGIGETVLDIVFDSANHPVSGKPGGSVYNALISLGRKNVPCEFISEVGDDRVGEIICNFLRDNGVGTGGVYVHPDSKSPLALAFLDENKNAQYSFYKDYKSQKLHIVRPHINPEDIVIFGSYFALNPVLRNEVYEFLRYAKDNGAILYYDVNFRSSHSHEVEDLMPTLVENFQLADVVKGSDEDFRNMFAQNDWRAVYEDRIAPYCTTFICTEGAKGATVITPEGEVHVDGQKITPVSTIGAGDSFNAGTVYGLWKKDIKRSDIANASQLAQAMKFGVEFATEVCQSLDNYIAKR
ncbi:MAG: carbohydrate kinase [Bacteroidales bacterium]|nr:carbohydrate kinase [Bacteroidales bacterium]